MVSRNALFRGFFVGMSLARSMAENDQPWNYECRQAMELHAGVSVVNTTEFASISAETGCVDPNRKGSLYEKAPSVWYSIIGTGTGLTAYTRPSFDGGKRIIRAGMSVYKGGCENLQCVSTSHSDRLFELEGDDDEIVTWFGASGVLYNILVQSKAGSYNEGAFQLVIEETDNVLPHDICEGALVVETGITGELSYAMSTLDFGFPETCRIPPKYHLVGNTQGLWYLKNGTGETITATLTDCKDIQDPYDYGVSVFSGACGSLECIGLKRCDDDDPVLSVNTTAGGKYFFLVEGRPFGGDLKFEVQFNGPSSSSNIINYSMVFAASMLVLVTLYLTDGM